jgi:hypothetical protein
MSLQQSSSETKMTAICSECGSAMRISAVTPIMFGNGYEDITYRCKECGNMRTRTVDTRGLAGRNCAL